MKRYERYKLVEPKTTDSGVSWIEEIPSGWELRKLNKCAFLSTKRSDSNENYIGMENIQSNTAQLINTSTIQIDGASFKTEPGDILFNKLRPYLAKVYVCVCSGCCSTEFFVLKSEHLNHNYLKYILLSPSFIHTINTSTYGTKMPRTNWDYVGNQQIPVPPRAEQDQIVRYLDWKVSRINKLIHAYQREIKLLEERKLVVVNDAVTKGLDPNVEMKDSGVSWIGEIPKGWEVTNIGHVYQSFLGKMLNNTKTKDGILKPYLCAKDVHFESINIKEPKVMYFSKDEILKYRIRYNDLLVVEGGAGAGGACVYKHHDELMVQNSIHIIRNSKSSDNTYLYYWLFSLVKRGYIDCVCNKATIPHFTGDKLKETMLPLPPLSEQQAIVTYLDAKCAQIEALKSKTQRKIELLTEYRTRLISDVVTGQIDVRDVVIPNYEVEEDVIEADDEVNSAEVCDGDEC